jgi:hypothetical protein
LSLGIYRGYDGIITLAQNPAFFRYEGLPEEEINEPAKDTECNRRPKGLNKEESIEEFEIEISDLLYSNSTRNKSKAGSFGYRAREPAANYVARTTTQDSTKGKGR